MKTLQTSHDELAQQLTSLISQMVYGHHSPTRAQVLMALAALRDAVPLVSQQSPESGMHPNLDYINDLIKKVRL